MNEKLYYSATDIAAMLGISMGKRHNTIAFWLSDEEKT